MLSTFTFNDELRPNGVWLSTLNDPSVWFDSEFGDFIDELRGPIDVLKGYSLL